MKENNLHSEGQKDYIKEVLKQQKKELKDLEQILISEEGKQSLVKRIKSKFRQLIKQSDDALFLTD